MKKSILLLILAPVFAFADVEKDFENLGGNKILLEKAKALNPDTKVTVVQERTVSRRNRWELSPEYSGTFGGDTYVKTQNVGLNVHYHITPQWSVGLKYGKSFNKLTEEGNNLYDKAIADYKKDPSNPDAIIPDIDHPREEQMAFVDYYPIYGKMNLLDQGIAQFDVYATLGYGQVKMRTATQPSYTAGGGLGIWWTKHFSTRLEMRYQNYKAQYMTGEKSLDLTVGSVQMGWMI
jgi:outer membrane beta-barrel protein